VAFGTVAVRSRFLILAIGEPAPERVAHPVAACIDLDGERVANVLLYPKRAPPPQPDRPAKKRFRAPPTLRMISGPP
jgi:hypothetical protein